MTEKYARKLFDARHASLPTRSRERMWANREGEFNLYSREVERIMAGQLKAFLDILEDISIQTDPIGATEGWITALRKELQDFETKTNQIGESHPCEEEKQEPMG